VKKEKKPWVRISASVFLLAVYGIFMLLYMPQARLYQAAASVGQFSDSIAENAWALTMAQNNIPAIIANVLVFGGLAIMWIPFFVKKWRNSRSSGTTTLLSLVLLIVAVGLASCKPYKGTSIVEVQPNQTAYLLPAQGDTSAQEQFDSVQYLSDNQVASKIIEIHYSEHKIGRMYWNIDFVPKEIVILVDRSPVFRQWTYVPENGAVNAINDSNRDTAAIPLESQESIGFWHGVVINAVIEEQNSAKFLYYFGGVGRDPDEIGTGVHLQVGLEQVIDEFVRGWVSDRLYADFKALSLEGGQADAGTIFANVESDAKVYFEDYGITILQLGGIGGLVYDNPDVQDVIDDKFERAAVATAAAITNKTNTDRGQAEATQTVIAANAQAESLALQGIELGKYPSLVAYEIATHATGEVPDMFFYSVGADQDTGQSVDGGLLPFPFFLNYPVGDGTTGVDASLLPEALQPEGPVEPTSAPSPSAMPVETETPTP